MTEIAQLNKRRRERKKRHLKIEAPFISGNVTILVGDRGISFVDVDGNRYTVPLVPVDTSYLD